MQVRSCFSQFARLLGSALKHTTVRTRTQKVTGVEKPRDHQLQRVTVKHAVRYALIQHGLLDVNLRILFSVAANSVSMQLKHCGLVYGSSV